MKNDIRLKIKKTRDSLCASEAFEYSAKICEKILATKEYRDACRIYAYFPLGNEVDVRPVVKAAWESGRSVALPKVRGTEMDFYEIHSFTELTEGAFHILEPKGDADPAIWEDALMLVPGVAFDRRGNRLGHGGGYYDKYLEGKPGIIKLAPAYGFQVLDEIPVEPTDIKMNLIVTEE